MVSCRHSAQQPLPEMHFHAFVNFNFSWMFLCVTLFYCLSFMQAYAKTLAFCISNLSEAVPHTCDLSYNFQQ
jgi:hypothetical protein